MKFGLAYRLIWYIVCPHRSSGLNKLQTFNMSYQVNPRPSLREVKMHPKLTDLTGIVELKWTFGKSCLTTRIRYIVFYMMVFAKQIDGFGGLNVISDF